MVLYVVWSDFANIGFRNPPWPLYIDKKWEVNMVVIVVYIDDIVMKRDTYWEI